MAPAHLRRGHEGSAPRFRTPLAKAREATDDAAAVAVLLARSKRPPAARCASFPRAERSARGSDQRDIANGPALAAALASAGSGTRRRERCSPGPGCRDAEAHALPEHETRRGVAQRWRTCFGSPAGGSGGARARLSTSARAVKVPIIVRSATGTDRIQK
jgi:hypothetical protein